MVSCSGFGLPMHAQLLRLFVTQKAHSKAESRPTSADQQHKNDWPSPTPGPVCAACRGILPAADGQACSGGYLCVYVRLASRCGPSQFPSVLLEQPSAPAPPRLGFRTGASVSVVCALYGSISRPQWELCPCVWCLGGTEGGVMCMWCAG